jgi:putative ABC transport system permease protein
MSTTGPPKIALHFFRWYCHPRLAYHIEGDLLEVYQKRKRKKGKRVADLRFVIDVLLLIRPGIIRPFTSNQNMNNSMMIKNYFLMGWRNIIRSKGYSAINIGGLAVGIAVTMLIGLWINDELSFDKSHKNYPRIGRVIQHLQNNDEKQTWFNVPFPLADELRKNYGADFKNIAMAVQWGDHMLAHEDKKLKMTGAYFEKEATEIFTLHMVMGSSALSEPASILLSASAAKAYFGDEEPLNQLMKIDDKPLVKVTGVYKDFPHNSTFANLQFISPWELFYGNGEWVKDMEDPWRPNFTQLFVELNDHVDFASATSRIKDAKLKRINEQLAKKKPELFLLPMSDWHLRSEFRNGVNTGGAIQYVWMFGIIGAFVLLLACINFMNLSTARSERRAKEVGVRKTIGSRSAQLTLQFFSESLLTVTLAFLLSLLLVQLVLPLFNEVANKQMTLEWHKPIYWVSCISIIILTALVAGSYPAFYLSSFKPVQVLKGTFKAGRNAMLPRKILVVTQFTVSVILIVGTVMVYRQIQFTKDRPVGYNRQNLITIPAMNTTIHDHLDAVKNELLNSGAIVSIAESESPTTGIWNSSSGFSWKGKDPNLSTDFGVVNASYDYGSTIGWQVKEGRGFSRDHLSDSTQ